MNKFQRKGRTLKMTIDDLFESPRFKIALEMFEEDPMLLKAIFIELGLETQNVTKYKIISEMTKMYSLGSHALKAYLVTVNDFDKYNIHWNMSPVELRYYSLNPKGLLPKREARALFKKIKQQFLTTPTKKGTRK